MKQSRFFSSIILLAILSSGCKSQNTQRTNLIKTKAASFKEDFKSQTRFEALWEDDSHQKSQSYFITNNQLKITTRPHSKDRVKVHTKRTDFGIGTYVWRIYIPEFELYDRCSVGAFIYHSSDAEYEFDFEIGSGKEKLRKDLDAKSNEALVFCTSQNAPFNSDVYKVEMGAYSEFKLKLSLVNDTYLVKWFINDRKVKSLQTQLSTAIHFSIYNSLENLSFMGNHLPKNENYVLFDEVRFE